VFLPDLQKFFKTAKIFPDLLTIGDIKKVVSGVLNEGNTSIGVNNS
jgi:hypothetical protein